MQAPPSPLVPPAMPPSTHPPPPGTPDAIDHRAYLDQQSNTWRYEDDNGDEWEWQPAHPAANALRLPKVQQEHDDDDDDDDAALAPPAPSPATKSIAAGRWVKVVDDDLIQAQQAAYGAPPPPSIDDNSQQQQQQQNASAGSSSTAAKKRKAGGTDGSASARGSTSTTHAQHLPPPSKRPKPITSLFVTGLPLDCTVEEIASVFSRYGLLLEDDEGKPRIKMYHDHATNQFKGEALVVYFKPESVDLAISLLDETSLRAAIGQTVGGGPTMRVQRAQFPAAGAAGGGSGRGAEKGKQSPAAAATATASDGAAQQPGKTGGDNGVPAQQPAASKRNLTDQERKKIQKRVARMENKLTDWDSPDEDPTPFPTSTSTNTLPGILPTRPTSTTPSTAVNTSESRTVVLKKMFTLSELDEDPTLLLDLKEDVREECNDTIGSVTNVVLWDREPEGVVTVKFRKAEEARVCVQKMNNRYFAGRRIQAFLLHGKPRFRRSGVHDDEEDEGGEGEGEGKGGQGEQGEKEEKEEGRRKDGFGVWLES